MCFADKPDQWLPDAGDARRISQTVAAALAVPLPVARQLRPMDSRTAERVKERWRAEVTLDSEVPQVA